MTENRRNINISQMSSTRNSFNSRLRKERAAVKVARRPSTSILHETKKSTDSNGKTTPPIYNIVKYKKPLLTVELLLSTERREAA